MRNVKRQIPIFDKSLFSAPNFTSEAETFLGGSCNLVQMICESKLRLYK